MTNQQLFHALESGIEINLERFGLVHVVGLAPESGVRNIHHWIATIRKGSRVLSAYVKCEQEGNHVVPSSH